MQSIIEFVRTNCTVTFDFSPNSYFRLKFDMIRYRDDLLARARALLIRREEDCAFLRGVAEQKVEEERRARMMGQGPAVEEEVGPDGEPVATPGGGRALAKFVGTVYTDSEKTVGLLEVGRW